MVHGFIPSIVKPTVDFPVGKKPPTLQFIRTERCKNIVLGDGILFSALKSMESGKSRTYAHNNTTKRVAKNHAFWAQITSK